ncbi:MAG: metal ABC transporter ATP-binding protein [Myxococcota bacterium]
MSSAERTPAVGSEVPDVLVVEDISVALGGRTILDRVGFRAAPGSFTGLIGSNGTGKTTLLKTILGIIRPTAGRVLIGGKAGSRRDPIVGYVPQKIELEPDAPLRARDLIGLGLDGHRFGVSRPSANRRRLIDAMIHGVNAADFADRRVGLLSGGEQQRVMIAHALISRPRLLLLDEPLANLDITSSHEVVQLLRHIATDQNIAIVLTAHDMNPLLQAMNRVVYLAGGRAASGTTAEVVRTETLSELYGHHVEVIHAGGRVLVAAGEIVDENDPPTLPSRGQSEGV